MDNTIIFGDLLAGLLMFFGLATVGFGLVASFGAGMASSPNEESRRIGRHGCMAMIVGAAMIVASIWWFVA